MSKAMKGTGIIKKLSKTLSRDSLITNSIYFICETSRTLWWYYLWQPNNDSLNKKIERIQYNAALAITVIIDVTSKSKLYKELSFPEI